MAVVLEIVRAEEGGDPHAFRTGVQAYLLRWPDGSHEPITITWDEALIADLAALRDPVRALEAAGKLGDFLQRLLSPTRWPEHAAVFAVANEAVDVEIRTAAAELYLLPWELLTLAGSGEHLAGLPGLRLRYRRPDAQPPEPPQAARPEGGRIVLACGSASGPIDPAPFVAAIAASARLQGLAFDPAADVLSGVSLADLIAALDKSAPPAILHIVGRGVARGDVIDLGLGSAAAPDVVDAVRIRELARFARDIRLVILTVCGAASGDESGAGASLIVGTQTFVAPPPSPADALGPGTDLEEDDQAGEPQAGEPDSPAADLSAGLSGSERHVHEDMSSIADRPDTDTPAASEPVSSGTLYRSHSGAGTGIPADDDEPDLEPPAFASAVGLATTEAAAQSEPDLVFALIPDEPDAPLDPLVPDAPPPETAAAGSPAPVQESVPSDLSSSPSTSDGPAQERVPADLSASPSPADSLAQGPAPSDLSESPSGPESDNAPSGEPAPAPEVERGVHLDSLGLALHAAGFEAVVSVRAPIRHRAALAFTTAFYSALLRDFASVDDALHAARRQVRITVSGNDWAQLQLHAPAGDARPLVLRPYRGLLAFEPEHAPIFFGRAAEVDAAFAALESLAAAKWPRLLVVAGASGTGKSSLVRAGLVPRYAARGVPAVLLRPGRDPVGALDEALAGRPAGRVLLVVDPFDELFTRLDALAHDDDDGRDRRLAAAREFARRLWRLAGDPSGQVAVVLTLGTDYLGRCGDLVLDDTGARLDRLAHDEAHRLFVLQPARERLREAIEGPGARLGITLEAGLCDRLIEDLGDDPAALPLVQHVLDALWLRRERDVLTHAALDALGGAAGALVRRAAVVLKDMSEEERAAARRLLVAAARYAGSPATGTRQAVVEAELRPAEPAAAAAWDRAVRTLVDARLVVRRPRPDGSVLLDISHAALIRRWPKLWSWYEEERIRLAELTQLRAWAGEWRRAPERILSGNRLGFALHLRDVQGDALGADARELLAASEAAEQRRRDDEQRQREEELRRRDDERTQIAAELTRARGNARLAWILVVLLLAGLAVAVLMWRPWAAAAPATPAAARK